MLEEQKRQVCDIAKEAERVGLCKQKAGNFSVRDAETGFIAITPAAFARAEMTPRDVVIINMDAEVVESLANLKPTSESLMHLEIYKARPDVFAVSHTHSIYATAFSILAKEIPAVVYECAALNLATGSVPVAPYGRPGSVAVSKTVIQPLAVSDAFLMERHGAVTVDKDPYEALLKSSYLEELAQLYYLALHINGGKDPGGIPAEELQKWQYPPQIKLL